MLRALVGMSLLFRNMCGGDDGGGACPGAYLCAVPEQAWGPQNPSGAHHASVAIGEPSCVDFGEPDARCGSAASCDATRTCENPDEACICFD
jgi:hypothetical protein